MGSDECDFDDLKVSIASFGYYLYRVAGCPYGDSLAGLTVWIDIQKETFATLADPNGRDEQDQSN